MNWKLWHRELSDLADDVNSKILQIKEPPNAIWFFEEKEQRPLIDEICKNYAETRSWPINMSQIQVVLVYARLIQAVDYAQKLAEPNHNPDPAFAEAGSERNRAITFLLVDYWHSTGYEHWLLES